MSFAWIQIMLLQWFKWPLGNCLLGNCRCDFNLYGYLPWLLEFQLSIIFLPLWALGWISRCHFAVNGQRLKQLKKHFYRNWAYELGTYCTVLQHQTVCIIMEKSNFKMLYCCKWEEVYKSWFLGTESVYIHCRVYNAPHIPTLDTNFLDVLLPSITKGYSSMWYWITFLFTIVETFN